MNLRKIFHSIDQNGSGKLSVDEFKTAIKELKLTIDSGDLEVIFKHFDGDKDSLISQQEFFNAIRSDMNEKRAKLANLAFNSLDADKKGTVSIADMKQKFNGNKHPAVLAGRKTEPQAVSEFTTALDLYQECYDLKAPTLTRKEFLEYYNNISNCIEEDQYFQDMMVNCWAVDPASEPEVPPEVPVAEAPPVKEEIKSEPAEEAKSVQEEVEAKAEPEAKEEAKKESEAAKRFRDSIVGRGPRSILGLERQFKVYTKDDVLEIEDFKKAVENFRLKVSQENLEEVFKELDKSGEGKILFDDIMSVILGRMTPRRKQLVDAAFTNIDKDNDGVANKEDIARIFEGWRHEDAKSGKVRADDMLNDVLETLNNATSLHRGAKCDGRYLREEFGKYFEYISVCTPNDEEFEKLFTTLWRVDVNNLPPIAPTEKPAEIQKEEVKEEPKEEQIQVKEEGKTPAKVSPTKDSTADQEDE
eukprot:TRINITY_DN12102_c0_g9_i2.p1 TRINITY_DN12102_c0_g9~~TRINITY_DN12102_c0_g9_i2.p1  ORF type:complete len:472 (-),score=193.05 TRINITY_DN12102_c0_g9_i2:797-2212(-)